MGVGGGGGYVSVDLHSVDEGDGAETVQIVKGEGVDFGAVVAAGKGGGVPVGIAGHDVAVSVVEPVEVVEEGIVDVVGEVNGSEIGDAVDVAQAGEVLGVVVDLVFRGVGLGGEGVRAGESVGGHVLGGHYCCDGGRNRAKQRRVSLGCFQCEKRSVRGL